ncbi:hypothetical protein M405DRAFT_824678 [Rhizopogon salebrosus TDB-379]|nr:hypothetical protein M405DRAFT_824678 [Rhizopogon salebrosus TDB-379]
MCASPIKGLTAHISISVTELAYGQKRVCGFWVWVSRARRGSLPSISEETHRKTGEL